MNRLLWWHWLLIGFGASLILFLILFFVIVKPRNDETARVKTEADGIETSGGTPIMVSQKKAELDTAKKATITINQDWKNQSAQYMPPIEFTKDPLGSYSGVPGSDNRAGVYHVNGRAFGVRDLPTVWGRWITFWYASQWRDGITPLNGFPIDSFSADPNDVSQLKAIAFPQAKPWDVEVNAKNFDAAMKHLARFNGIQRHGMPVVDKVALAGQSPNLRLKYTLQLFVIPPTEPPAPDPKISGAAAASSGGGGSGGGGGGGMSSMGMGKGKMGGM